MQPCVRLHPASTTDAWRVCACLCPSQDCNERAQLLQSLLSINREQGISAHTADLQALFTEACTLLQQSLLAAAAAKQSLLTSSSQHSRQAPQGGVCVQPPAVALRRWPPTCSRLPPHPHTRCRSCFCRLLERLHLLDALWQASSPGVSPAQPPCAAAAAAATAAAVAHEGGAEIEPDAEQAPPQLQRPAMPCIYALEAQLRGCPGLDAVLAALISHAQLNAAAGSKAALAGVAAGAGKQQEATDVSCLSAVQEQHSAARALPLLLRLYFNTGSRDEVRWLVLAPAAGCPGCLGHRAQAPAPTEPRAMLARLLPPPPRPAPLCVCMCADAGGRQA
jgi:hypothetical protein